MGGITVKVDVAAVKQRFNDLADKDVPFFSSFAINETLKDAQTAEVNAMKSEFEGGATEWTQNSTRIDPSNKGQDRISGALAFREFAAGGNPAWKYLTVEIEGGLRRVKAFERRLISAGVMRSGEYAVPGEGVPLDAFGNIPTGLLTQLLSQVSALSTSGSTANMSGRSRKGALARAGGRYFLLRGTKAPNGIYFRGANGRSIKPILIFVRAPVYTPRFTAYQTARKAVNENFGRHFAEAFAKYGNGRGR